MRGVAVDLAWNDTFVERHDDAIATVVTSDRKELGAIRAVSVSAPGSTLSLADPLARNGFRARGVRCHAHRLHRRRPRVTDRSRPRLDMMAPRPLRGHDRRTTASHRVGDPGAAGREGTR